MDVLEEVSVQAQEVVDSAGPGEEVAVVTHEEVEDTMETEDMVIGAMVTEALVVGRGALVVVVVDTGVEDTPQEEEVTEKTEVRVAMVTAPDHTGMDMTAMLHTSKHLPDSRSSLGWLYFKDALLKTNVHMLLLTF